MTTNSKLIGFFPKNIVLKPINILNNSINEICSVSNCLSDGPPKWIENWLHNIYGFYENEITAINVAKDLNIYSIFAFKIFPFYIEKGVVNNFIAQLNYSNSLSAYEFLGFDIVTKSTSDFFECSPLSCNNAADEFSVNKYCLIDSYENALVSTIKMSQGNYEPGKYYIFEVYKKI